MSMTDFNSKLTDTYEEVLKSFNNDTISIHDTKIRLGRFKNEYIPKFEKFIPDFFSKNVEADNVRMIYRTIREQEFPNKTINCVDVYKASEIYQEYVHGMVDFLHEIIECANTAFDVREESKYNDLITKATARDYEFIKSCFGGSMNPPVDQGLKDAVRNVEMLIDFNDQLTTFENTTGSMIESISDVDSDNELLSKAVNLYVNSVIRYCYFMIFTIFDSYDKIYSVITAPAPKPQTKFELL